MKAQRAIGIVLVVTASGCIDPLEWSAPPVDYRLVVDGSITNDPGPYTVMLYRERPLERDVDRFVVEKGATVRILSNQGESETLNEVSAGVYQTAANGIRGKVGVQYHVEIETLRGGRYYSTPDEIKPVGEIESIRYETEEGPFVDTLRTDRIKLFASARGVEKNTDLLRFRRVGTFQIHTFPEKHTRKLNGQIVPDPLPCSGWVAIDGILFQKTECTCCDCWVTEKSEVPILYDEKYTGMDAFNDVYLGDIMITPYSFGIKYHMEIQQLSLTESTYKFWNLVRVQKVGATDLFQPPTGSLKGNIFSSNDFEAPLGIFWAAGISKKAIFFDYKDSPNPLEPPFSYTTDCRLLEYTTNRKPSFWP